MQFSMLRLDQSRQMADLRQAFDVMEEGRERLAHYRGTMRWKKIRGREYLYRRTGATDVSLGARSMETEAIKAAFDEGKANAQAIHETARNRIEEMAPVNRAMGLGRVPQIAARIARKLADERLLGTSLSIVGTNSLYCYEAMAGGHFAAELASTDDIDLLLDSRRRLQIVSDEFPVSGLVGILQSIDHSFRRLSNGFRVVNRDNYLVDLIAPAPRHVLHSAPQGVTNAEGDLVAAEIDGLQWLLNGPKVSAMSVDVRGLPVRMTCIDPRYYAIHKLWLSGRDDREPARRLRDRAQAIAVARLVTDHLPTLRFDDRALESLPKALRERAGELMSADLPRNAGW